MHTYELNYGGERALGLPGLVGSVAKGINYFLKEVEILECVEQALSEFISKSVAELNQENQRGNFWLDRFNARAKGQDAFYIHFNPTAKEEEKVRFVQSTIAEGRFLTKEIRFFEDRCLQLPYIQKEVVPFLKAIFTKFGFKVLKEEDSFS